MTWVAVEFNSVDHIRDGSSILGLPSPNEPNDGQYDWVDFFSAQVEYNRSFGTSVINSLNLATQFFNVQSYVVGVDYLGFESITPQGLKFYHGFEVVSVGRSIFAEAAYSDGSDPIYSLEGRPGGLELIIQYAGSIAIFSYAGEVGDTTWIYYDFGGYNFSVVSDVFNFNTVDYREYRSQQNFWDAQGGNDVVVLPNSITAASIWGYSDNTPFWAGSGNDSVTGGVFDDDINGGTGNDRLLGGAGNDYVRGQEGSDTVSGGSGADWLSGGPGTDTLDYTASPSAVFVTTSDYSHGGDAEGDLIGEFEVVRGSSYNDTIYTGSTLPHAVGLGGNDRFILREMSSSGRIEGGNGTDTVDLSLNFLFSGVQVNLAAGTLVADGIAKTLLSIENAIGPIGNDTIQGSSVANVLSGIDGNDLLIGDAGADVLRGGLGKDTLQGGAGFDRFDFDLRTETRVGTNCDMLNGDASAPAFENAGSAAGDVIDLSGIDANVAISGDQSFAFLTTQGIGTLRCVDSGAVTKIFGYIDAVAGADFEIDINDGSVLAARYVSSDFVL